MSLYDRIVPSSACQWGRLTKSWPQTLTVTLTADTSSFQRAIRIARAAAEEHAAAEGRSIAEALERDLQRVNDILTTPPPSLSDFATPADQRPQDQPDQ